MAEPEERGRIFNFNGGTNGEGLVGERKSLARGGGGFFKRSGREDDEGRPSGRNSVVGEMRGLDDLMVVRSLGSREF